MLNPSLIRRHVLTLAYNGQTAHVGCALSIVEMLCLVFNHYPEAELVLSKGHGVMALYACQYALGKLSQAEFDNYMKPGGTLLGLNSDPATGSLGHGLPIACGMAYGLRKMGNPKHVFVVVGDGEMQEGSCWEAVQFIAKEKLENITILVDANRYQAMGKSEPGIEIENRLRGFGLSVIRAQDGHDVAQMRNLMEMRPQALVCDTIKGHGVSFMENKNEFHYQRLTQAQYEQAMRENAG